MPERYHGQRVQRSLVVKLTNRELLDRAARLGKPLNWHGWGVALSKLNIPAARETANALQAEDHLQVTIPKEWTHVTPLPAAFAGEPAMPSPPQLNEDASSVQTSTERVGSSSEDSPSDSGATPGPQLLPAGACLGSPAEADTEELAIKLADLSWQATKYHGQLHVHFLQSDVEYPAWKRKRGIMDRQALNRINAQGQDVATIRKLSSSRLLQGLLASPSPFGRERQSVSLRLSEKECVLERVGSSPPL